ncbi:HAD-like domain-containing protein, partial [Obelidium mucronatum]
MTSYVATLIAPATGFTAFAENIKKIITGNNGSISQEKILHNETSKSNLFPNRTIHEISFSLPSASDAVSGLKKAVFAEAVKHSSPGLGYNVAIQLDSVYRRHKRLVVFDMDSTLIEQEVIDEIARCCGVVDQVAAITESAMNGEIDFKESLARLSVLETVRAKITFTPGVRDLCKVLKRLGFQLAVISGGFLPLAKYVKAELNLDFAYANQLQVSQDGTVLEGKTFGPIVDGTRKAELLDVIAQSCNVGVNQVVAVGDGANDLPMLGLAGLGVAFNAKPRVQEQAEVCINQSSLLFVLALLGLTSDEIAEALKA